MFDIYNMSKHKFIFVNWFSCFISNIKMFMGVVNTEYGTTHSATAHWVHLYELSVPGVFCPCYFIHDFIQLEQTLYWIHLFRFSDLLLPFYLESVCQKIVDCQNLKQIFSLSLGGTISGETDYIICFITSVRKCVCLDCFFPLVVTHSEYST